MTNAVDVVPRPDTSNELDVKPPANSYRPRPRNPSAVLVEEDLDEMEGGIEILTDGTERNDPEPSAKMLCQFSRNVMFTLGNLSDYTTGFLDKVINVFERTTHAIPAGHGELVDGFRNHIERRVQTLRSHVNSRVERTTRQAG